MASFGAPGDLTPMDAGIPYTTNYYTRGSSIYNIQDNKILRAGFERKNISVMLTYDITENHQLFMDVYNNNYYAEDDENYKKNWNRMNQINSDDWDWYSLEQRFLDLEKEENKKKFAKKTIIQKKKN